MGFKLGEENVDGNGVFKDMGGRHREKKSRFSLKGRGGKERKGIIPTFSLALHTCDPAAKRPQLFLQVFSSLFFNAYKSLWFPHSV